MKYRIAALSLFAVAAAHLASKQVVARLRTNADPYPLEQLSLEPSGDEALLVRPDGARIRSGPTVVLAHGYGVSLIEWNVIWQLLRDEGYNLIAFDQRGHGKSTLGSARLSAATLADDYKAVLDHFDVRQAILVGHSMGGFLALAFALKYPEVVRQRLSGLLLCATLAGDVMRGAPQNTLQIPLMKSGFVQKVAASETYGWLFARSLCGDNPSPAVLQAFLKVFLQQPHKTLAPLLQMLAQENYYPRLGELALPCVVVCGTKDKATPAWHSQGLGRGIANACTVWVANKGHLLNWEAPEVLVEAVSSLAPAIKLTA